MMRGRGLPLGASVTVLALWSALLMIESRADGPLAPPLPAIEAEEATDLAGLATSSRYDVYRAVAEVMEGGTVLIGAGVRQPGWIPSALDPVLLLGLSGVEQVVRVDVAETPQVGGASTSGTYWGGRWRIERLEGPVTALLATSEAPGSLVLTDARLVPWLEVPAVDPPATRPLRAPTDAPAWLLEAVLLVLVALVGGLLLPRDLPAAIRTPLALLAGVAGLAVTGALRPPGAWGLLVLALLGAAGAAGLAVGGAASGWRGRDAPMLVAVGLATAVGSALVRANGWVVANPDSVDYLAGASVMSKGLLAVEMLQPKRGLAQQALHAPMFALGGDWLHVLGPVVLVATAWLLAAALWSAADSAPGRAAALLAPLLLLLSPAVRVLGMFVNSHTIVAGLLLALVVLIGAVPSPRAGTGGGVPAAAVIAAALVLLRPEGIALVALVLLGGVALAERRPVVDSALVGAGIAAVAWNGLLIAGAAARGEPLPSLLVVLVLSGVAAALLPAVLWRLDPVVRRRSAIGCIGLLWVLAAAVTVASERNRFWGASRANLLEGAGGWGLLPPLVMLLVIAAVVVAATGGGRGAADAPAWSLLLGIVPLLLLAKLLDGPGDAVLASGRDLLAELGGRGANEGWRDSVNRSWLHPVPVALLLSVRAIGGDGRRRRPPRWLLATAAGALVATVALWDPALPVGRAEDVALVAPAALDRPVGELVASSRVVEVIPGDARALAAAAALDGADVCATVVVGTYGRPVAGGLAISVAGPAATVGRRIDGSALVDNALLEVCAPLAEVGSSGPFTVEVEADGGSVGDSATLWSSGDVAGTARFALVDRPGIPIERSGPVVHSLRVRGTVLPDEWRIAQDAARRAPVAGAAILGAVLLGPGGGPRRGSGRHAAEGHRRGPGA